MLWIYICVLKKSYVQKNSSAPFHGSIFTKDRQIPHIAILIHPIAPHFFKYLSSIMEQVFIYFYISQLWCSISAPVTFCIIKNCLTKSSLNVTGAFIFMNCTATPNKLSTHMPSITLALLICGWVKLLGAYVLSLYHITTRN